MQARRRRDAARCLTVKELAAALRRMPQGSRVRFLDVTASDPYARDVSGIETVASLERRLDDKDAPVQVRMAGLRPGEVVLTGARR